jgi:hypothetical protein
MFVAVPRVARHHFYVEGPAEQGDGHFAVWFQAPFLGRKLQKIGISYGAVLFEFFRTPKRR